MDEEKKVPEELGESEELKGENETLKEDSVPAEEIEAVQESVNEESTEEAPEEPAAEDEEKAAEESAEEETEEVTEEPTVEPEEESESVEDVDEATRVFSAVEQTAPVLDGIALACELCEAVQAATLRDGFHGGVRPDNISVQDGKVKLGSPLEHGVGEFTPQELEYMSPELFWDGKRSGSADVYSIGLVLYSVYNHGLMPFWPVDAEATPNIRAAALQRRMNREELPPPTSAGPELSQIILRALAFTPEERWNDTEELRNALKDCTEEQPRSEDISSVLSGMMERSARRTEKKTEVSSPFVGSLSDVPPEESPEEETIPKVKVRRSAGRLPQVLVYLALGFAIVAIVLLLRRCVALDEEARVTPTPPVAAVKEPSDDKVISGNLTEETDPGAETEPEPTAEPTAEPTPEPTAAPVGTVEYIAVKENVSWSQAVVRCEEMGGVLAMPTTYEEFQTITAKCEEQGLTFVWLNAQRNAEGSWVNDKGEEDAFFFAWGDGEPSKVDGGDGAAEDYFLLWNYNGRWSGNDSRENPLANYMNVYGGKIGFVCKKVTYESVNITDLGG